LHRHKAENRHHLSKTLACIARFGPLAEGR
jgi:hypothetical protein